MIDAWEVLGRRKMVVGGVGNDWKSFGLGKNWYRPVLYVYKGFLPWNQSVQQSCICCTGRSCACTTRLFSYFFVMPLVLLLAILNTFSGHPTRYK